ncbi:MAG: multidrug transporter [Cyanobacteria bacterium J06650_10]
MPSEHADSDYSSEQTSVAVSSTPVDIAADQAKNTDNETPQIRPGTGSDIVEDKSSQRRFVRRPTFPGFRKTNKPLRPAVALAMLLIASFVGWRAFQKLTTPMPGGQTEATRDQARLPVRVVTAQMGQAQGWAFDQGTVWPVRRRLLNFQASGDITYVAQINGEELREGDFVSRGQLLATIDDRRQVSSIETAEADIDVSVNQRNQSESSLLQAQANLEKGESDLNLAQTELQRYDALFAQGAVSESDRDAYQNRVDQAEAALKTAQQDVRLAEDGIRSATANMEASRSRFNQTAVDLEDTQLISPIDGVVAYVNIREGEYWSTQYFDRSNAQNAIETAPIVVMDAESFEVELELQSDAAEDVCPGQRAYVVLEEDVSAAQAAGANRQDLLALAKEKGSEGRVFSVSPSQTPGGRGTEVSIRNLQQVRNLKVGGQAYVWIEVATANDAVVLPIGALLPRNQEYFAFVVNPVEGSVQRRQVNRGIEGLSGVEILSGIEPGELVVVEGQNRLVEGTPVEIINRERLEQESRQKSRQEKNP